MAQADDRASVSTANVVLVAAGPKSLAPQRRTAQALQDETYDFGWHFVDKNRACVSAVALLLMVIFFIPAVVLSAQWSRDHPSRDKVANYNKLVSAWSSGAMTNFAAWGSTVSLNTSIVATSGAGAISGWGTTIPFSGFADNPPVSDSSWSVTSYPNTQRVKLSGGIAAGGSASWPTAQSFVAADVTITASLAGGVPAGGATVRLPLGFADSQAASAAYYFVLRGLCFTVSGVTPARLVIPGPASTTAGLLDAADGDASNLAISPGCGLLPASPPGDAVEVPQLDSNTPLGGGGNIASFPTGAQGLHTYNSVGVYERISGPRPSAITFSSSSPLTVEYRSAADPWAYAASVGVPTYSSGGGYPSSLDFGRYVSVSVRSGAIACWFFFGLFAVTLLVFNLPPFCASAGRIVSDTADTSEDSHDVAVTKWFCSCFLCGAVLGMAARGRGPAAIRRRKARSITEKHLLSWLFAGCSYVVFLVLGAMSFPSPGGPGLTTGATKTMSAAGIGGNNPSFAGAVVSMGSEAYPDVSSVTVGTKAHALFGLEAGGFIIFHGTPAALLLLVIGAFVYALFARAAAACSPRASTGGSSAGVFARAASIIERSATAVLAGSIVLFPTVGIFLYALGAVYISAMGQGNIAQDGRCASLIAQGLSPDSCSLGIALSRWYPAAAAFGCCFLTTVYALLLSSCLCYGGSDSSGRSCSSNDVLLPLTGWVSLFGACCKCGDGSWKRCACLWSEDYAKEQEAVWPPPPPPSLCRQLMAAVGLAPPLPLPPRSTKAAAAAEKDKMAQLAETGDFKAGPSPASSPSRNSSYAAAGMLGRLALAQNESPKMGRGRIANPLPRLGLHSASSDDLSPVGFGGSKATGSPARTNGGAADDLDSAATRTQTDSSALDSSQLFGATAMLQSPQIKLSSHASSLSSPSASLSSSNIAAKHERLAAMTASKTAAAATVDPHAHSLSSQALANLSARILLPSSAAESRRQKEQEAALQPVVIPLSGPQPSFRIMGALERSSSTRAARRGSKESLSSAGGLVAPSTAMPPHPRVAPPPVLHRATSSTSPSFSASQRHLGAMQDATMAAEHAAAAALRRQLELSNPAGNLAYFRPEAVAHQVLARGGSSSSLSPGASPARGSPSAGTPNRRRRSVGADGGRARPHPFSSGDGAADDREDLYSGR